MNILEYGTTCIAYSLEWAERKTLAITVHPDCSVRVRAPHGTEEGKIDRVLLKRAPWILRQQRFFSQFNPRRAPRQYVSGETHLYMGRQYRLRIRVSETECVKLAAGYISIFVHEPSHTAHIQELLQDWYDTHSKQRIPERFNICLNLISAWKLPTPTLQLKHMKRRWGNCHPDGTIILNYELIRAPRACIDYVILHELCHLRYPNHKPEFYRLLASILPDWQARKQRLETILS